MTDGERRRRSQVRRDASSTILNYNHLHYFHVAASEGSVARAAERLGVTQPTVSEQIRNLERSLSVTLFDRSRAGIRLTDAGRRAFEHTSVMFRAGERLIASLGRAPTPEEATVRVGVTWAASRSIPADFLFPLVALDGCTPSVSRGELSDLLPGLRRKEVDLVLAEAVPTDGGGGRLRVVDVYRPRLVAIAHPRLAMSASWAEVPMVHHLPGSIHRDEIDGFLARDGLRPRIVASVDDPLLMLACAARGTGLAFVPEHVARPAIAAGQVRLVATLDLGPVVVHAVHRDPPPDWVRRAVSALQSATE